MFFLRVSDARRRIRSASSATSTEGDGVGELGKRLAVFSTSVVLTLLVAEGALRLLVPTSFWNPPFSPVWEWLVYDPVRGWKNQPGYSSEFFRIDSMGLRGAERPRRKPAGVVRIVSLGDSGTFGI